MSASGHAATRSLPAWRGQVIVALIASIAATAPVVALAIPVAALGVALVPLVIISVFSYPFLVCLTFVVFSFFRIHEAFPILGPLHIPQALAIAALIVLAWHVFMKRSVQPYWTREFTAFAVFFALVTIGILVASDKAASLAYWTDTYVKIGIMTLAVAWLTRQPRDFAIASHGIVLAGMAIAMVTLYNKVNGIGLVEGTRVTIGRDIGSVLGDPNDLSLVLLFPLSFAASLVVRRIGWLSAAFGAAGVVLIAAAIIATQSRGGLLGMMAVFGVVGSQGIKSKAVLISLALIATIGLFAVAGISERSSGGVAEEGIDESSMGRIYAWKAAWHMATARPLTGVGVDNFVSNYYMYSEFWDGKNHAVHSTWFGVLAETGFPGLIAFVVMVAIMATTAFKANRILNELRSANSTRAAGLASLAGIAGFCVAGTFLTQGFTWPIYVLLAMTTAIGRFANCELQKSESIKSPTTH
jgi:hypothetical protein